jgi:accessory colonization factor AcfC
MFRDGIKAFTVSIETARQGQRMSDIFNADIFRTWRQWPKLLTCVGMYPTHDTPFN